MKYYLKPVFALTMLVLLAATSVQAVAEEKMIIALKTDGFELTETDISSLAVGESQTIETDSGKVIDIIRTAAGAEIYVDGELLLTNLDSEGLHKKHMIKKHVQIICGSDEGCDKHVFILDDGDDINLDWVTDDGDHVFIHKEIKLSCTDEEEGTNCGDKMVWISEGEDMDLDGLHEMHLSGEGHKIIVIRKELVTQD